ncbi:MAG: M20/M25/M40 family metallo-hydrolase, partial [Gammaproteobacteria bacterium]|nr:M20/M25/M40 family metallo-hydrolase [Gammaproteobacteria bacterium]
MTNEAPLKINKERLWSSVLRMAEIGATAKGGCRRLALSDEDADARKLFLTWAAEVGCSIKIDSMGNIFARREGIGSGSYAPVATGSHLDTQPSGGKFDGPLGVICGIEVLRTLDDYGIKTEKPIEVVVWTNEEGSRFAPAMVGSGVFSGIYDLEYGLSRTDRSGITIQNELERLGYVGSEKPGQHKLDCFFEVHIEQGPILEAN